MSDKYAGACWNELMANESKESIAELYMDALAALRAKDAEIERLNKMRTHCENCGADYVAMGLEAGCPCKLKAENASLKAQLEQRNSLLDKYNEDNARMNADVQRLYEALKEVLAITDRKHDVWDKARAAIKAHEESAHGCVPNSKQGGQQ